jgi:hypothetical protein
MYKITITDRYNLYKYSIYSKEYILVDSFKDIPHLKLYIKRKVLNIKLNEVDIGIKFMEDTQFNTMETGVNGTFTVAYFDESIEE